MKMLKLLTIKAWEQGVRGAVLLYLERAHGTPSGGFRVLGLLLSSVVGTTYISTCLVAFGFSGPCSSVVSQLTATCLQPQSALLVQWSSK